MGYDSTAIVLSEKLQKLLTNNLEVKKKCLPLQSQNERGVPEKVQKFLKRLALKKS